jgi:hypothetical protein
VGDRLDIRKFFDGVPSDLVVKAKTDALGTDSTGTIKVRLDDAGRVSAGRLLAKPGHVSRGRPRRGAGAPERERSQRGGQVAALFRRNGVGLACQTKDAVGVEAVRATRSPVCPECR